MRDMDGQPDLNTGGVEEKREPKKKKRKQKKNMSILALTYHNIDNLLVRRIYRLLLPEKQKQ